MTDTCRASIVRRICLLTLAAGAAAFAPAAYADWPTWRANAARTAVSGDMLTGKLQLHWSRRMPAPRQAWPDEPRMQFDAVGEPVAAGGMLFVPSSRCDSVTALDAASGAERWRFYADGPVRFAPAAWKAPGGEWRLFVAGDDGLLYCLDAATGELRWKFRGGPDARRVLGNGRLISAWPARGGPVVADGVVYFAAGIWPFMGVFIHALDAAGGKVVWTNDSSGSTWTMQPHKSPAFGGLAPQGYLAVLGDMLLVPNGRAVPAGLDRRSGRLLYFQHAVNHRTGNSYVAGFGAGRFISGGNIYDANTGDWKVPIDWRGVGDPPAIYQSVRTPLGQAIAAVDPNNSVEAVYADAAGGERKVRRLRHFWELPTPARPLIRAGGQLLAADANSVLAIELPDLSAVPAAPVLPALPVLPAPAPLPPRSDKPANGLLPADDDDDAPPKAAPRPKALPPTVPDRPLPAPKVAWRLGVGAEAASLLVADGRLFVVTRDSEVLCYGPGEAPQPPPSPPPAAAPPADPNAAARAAEALAAAGTPEGYCLLAGMTDGGLAEQIARQSRMHVIVVDANAAGIEALRRRLDASGLYGSRVAALAAEPLAARLPKYFASLIVSQRPEAIAAAPERLFERLRPYGGCMCLSLSGAQREALAGRVAAARLDGAELSESPRGLAVLRRAGPLKGAGTWTGQYADAGNTCASDDRRVRLPLGLLWFAAPDNRDLLPRHGHGPPEQVIGGRLFIEGPDILRAVDVYTGRRLWQRDLPGIGRNFNYTVHIPGANALGTNFAATKEGVYVARGQRCLLLGAATGQTLRELMLPDGSGSGGLSRWGYVSVWQDLLIAGATPMDFQTPDVEHAELMRVWWDAKLKRHVTSGPSRAAASLASAVRTWRDFAPVQDAAPEVLPVPAVEPDGPAAAADYRQQVKEVYSVVANFNKMLRQRDVLSKLPASLVAAARTASVTARRKAEDFAASQIEKAERLALPPPDLPPPPRTVGMIEAEIRDHLRLAGAGFDAEADLTLRQLNRELLEWCYRELPRKPRQRPGHYTHSLTASRELAVLERLTGKLLWRRTARGAFKHNAIAAGGGKVFCIDRLPDQVIQKLLFRGQATPPSALLALDARGGKLLWQADQNAFGTWLGYSADHDVLLQAARPSRDMLRDEPGGRLVAFRGSDGKLLWDTQAQYGGPCILRGRNVITQGVYRRSSSTTPEAGSLAFDLLTGQPLTRPHPLSGETIPWTWSRNYGCNTAVASQNLLTFRSAAAGFFDLAGMGGTGNFGGFRSGCTSNLVVADGVLNAPDYTRSCTCSYQNQASLALVHAADADAWTFQSLPRGKENIRRVGINLGAPGDRLADDGTLWLDWPAEGGPSPHVTVVVKGTDLLPVYFRRHPSAVRGEGLRWVAASGAEAIASLQLYLTPTTQPLRPAGKYTVSLHFAEPGSAAAGQRIFSVALQGREVLKDLDVAGQAGGALRPLVKTFRGVEVNDALTVTFQPAPNAEVPRPVLSGLEAVAEPAP